MMSAVASPGKTLAPVSPSTPWSLLSLPTAQTMVFEPPPSVWLTAGEPLVADPPHQATERVGGFAAPILRAVSPPDCPLGHPEPLPLNTKYVVPFEVLYVAAALIIIELDTASVAIGFALSIPPKFARLSR